MFVRNVSAEKARVCLFTAFHLNLNFSSIEESSRPEVIARCYWPLLNLASVRGVRLGIEMTASTLEIINELDRSWITEFREAQARGDVELLGSGYSQVISPLVPWRLNLSNLLHGNLVYDELLNVRPRVLFVNEQATSASIVDLASESGYEALIVEWENSQRANPLGLRGFRATCPQLRGPEGAQLPVLWNSSLMFQKIQRLAHGELAEETVINYLRSQTVGSPNYFCLYGGDAEVFDFRPGRYGTEADMKAGEWDTIKKLFARLADSEHFEFSLPSELYDDRRFKSLAQISLQSAEEPVPTKKQRKYNVTRWAVSGRGDTFVNTQCQLLHDDLKEVPLTDGRWRQLCGLWASDFRTHITQSRWEKLLGAFPPDRTDTALSCAPLDGAPAAESGRFVTLKNATTEVVLDLLKGCSILDTQFLGEEDGRWFGGVDHATFEDVRWSADWFSGHLVFEAPGQPKVTDLDGRSARMAIGTTSVRCYLPSPLGPIVKTVSLLDSGPGLSLHYELGWDHLPIGSLRLGHVLLIPEEWDEGTLRFASHFGGRRAELFDCELHDFDHGEHVSFLVSASTCVGMTEGVVWIGDGMRSLEIQVRQDLSKSVGLVSHRRIGDKTFFQFCASILELDETSREQALSLQKPIEFEMTVRPTGPIGADLG